MRDGNEPATEDDGETRALRTIFVNVTGAEEVVERQDESGSSRLVGEDEDAAGRTLPEYVATMVEADGLSGALDGPDTGDGSD